MSMRPLQTLYFYFFHFVTYVLTFVKMRKFFKHFSLQCWTFTAEQIKVDKVSPFFWDLVEESQHTQSSQVWWRIFFFLYLLTLTFFCLIFFLHVLARQGKLRIKKCSWVNFTTVWQFCVINRQSHIFFIFYWNIYF